jgi:4-hydroxythreonine-4-phosphate dehydrogenase
MSNTGSKSAEPRPGRAPVIAVTSGEPAGIGPDICLDIAGRVPGVRVVVLGDAGLLEERRRALRIDTRLVPYAADRQPAEGALEVLNVSVAKPVKAGVLDPANSPYVLALIDRAIDGCRSGEFAAVTTAPVNKAVINDAGIDFTGHTEYLAERCGVPRVVMMLAGAGLRVALATTHLALKDVPAAITGESLDETLRILLASLARDFGAPKPRVLVAGLNPHSGEGGHFGREDVDIIAPVIDRLRAEGHDLSGPIPADTLFNPARLKGVDAVLAMYHDQGLPVLKFASFGEGVNITLGLPIIRTSVDHGTALDLAGTGKADAGSLVTAIETAAGMARHAAC